MSGARGLRILALPAKTFPCDHPMLETVLASMLPALGHQVTWVMASSDASRRTARWHESVVHTVPAGTGGLVSRARANLALLRTAEQIGRREQVDVVFVRNAVRSAIVALWLRRTTGCRFVFQFSFPVAERTKVLAGRRPGVSTARRISAELAVRARRWVIGRADLVLAISERMRRDLEHDGVKPDRIAVMPLAAEIVDPTAEDVDAARAALGADERPLVLYVGAIAPERRLDMLMDVAAEVHERHPSARWALLGPAAAGEDDRLRTLARNRGLGDFVAVHDRIPRARIPACIAAATITVSPIPADALFVMASPTKVVESLAAGTPVVVTPIEDQKQLVTASGGGLVAGFDAPSFAEAVCRLLDAPEAARSMGRRGQAFVAEHRTWRSASAELDARLVALSTGSQVGSPA